MKKIEKLYTRRRYIVSSAEIKKCFGVKGTIITFGLWEGTPPTNPANLDPDTFDKWYIEANDEE